MSNASKNLLFVVCTFQNVITNSPFHVVIFTMYLFYFEKML